MLAYLLEVREKARPAPARVSKSLPGIIIVSTTPVPAHSVQDATTAEYFALWHDTWVAIELRLWHGCQTPVVATADIRANVGGILYALFIMVATHVSKDILESILTTHGTPASMQSTVRDGISESRFVTTSPLIPQPTTI